MAMSPDLPEQVQHAVESICTLGCNRVNEIIEDVDQGIAVKELNGLSKDEIRTVKQELQKIMAVYTD
jgi:ribosomal protein S13